MSSGQDIQKCPQCGGMYIIDCDFRTREVFCFCSRCGKSEEHAVVWDENNKAVLDENGQVKYTDADNAGFGCMKIAGKDGMAKIYHLTEPLDERVKAEFLEALKEPEIDGKNCYLTAWDEEKKEIVAIFGGLPLSYDDFVNKAKR